APSAGQAKAGHQAVPAAPTHAGPRTHAVPITSLSSSRGGNALRSPVLARCFRRARVAAASSEGRSRQLRKRFSAIASSVVSAIVSSIRIPSPPQRGENYPFFWIKSKRLLYRTKAPACHSAPLGAYTGFGCALSSRKVLDLPWATVYSSGHGEVAEWSEALPCYGSRPQKGLVGSNPILSARKPVFQRV